MGRFMLKAFAASGAIVIILGAGAYLAGLASAAPRRYPMVTFGSSVACALGFVVPISIMAALDKCLVDAAWSRLDDKPAEARCAENEYPMAFVHRWRNAH